MSGVSKAISDQLYERCVEALKAQGEKGKLSTKLRAIISAKEHNISEVAKIFGITRATLFRWIKNFEHHSVDGLTIKRGRGRKSRLNECQKQQVKEMLEACPHLTGKVLLQRIKEELSIDISIAATYRLMHSLGFNYITARKMHYKHDSQAKTTFKKTSQYG